MRERLYLECPKCGARGGCEKHGLSSTGIDLRARANHRSQLQTPLPFIPLNNEEILTNA